MYHLSAALGSRNPSDELSDPRRCLPTGDTVPPTARRLGPGEPGDREYGDVLWCRRADVGNCVAAVAELDVGADEACVGDACVGFERVVRDVVVKFELCVVEDWWCAACAKAVEREAPEMAPVGEVDAFWTPERARKAVRKLEKKGRFVDMVRGVLVGDDVNGRRA